jgi:uncharacterized protein (TIGR02284 family)
MAEHIVLDKVESTLKDVIETLRDGHQGFIELGQRMQDATARRFFMEETQVRAEYAAELENELHRLGVKDVKVRTSPSSKAHRFWGELKAKLGGGDHALLDTAEQGEDVAKKAYADALKQELPLPIRELLVRQQEHIVAVHDKVKAMRDSKK